MKPGNFINYMLVAMVIGLPANAFGMPAEELKDLLDRKEAVTLIDVRETVQYSAAHIPGAINIPARLCASKRLPPIGRVVVYGDGIGTGEARAAAEALRQKSGVSVEMLDGGYPAWEELGLPDTGPAGFSGEKIRYLTYPELVKAVEENPDLVLVDLRGPDAGSGGGRTDLSARFPVVRYLDARSHKGTAGESRSPVGDVMAGRGTRSHPLYVLIDDGDGTSETTSRQLRAAGLRRLAVLSGGEKALRMSGETGLRTISR